MYKYNRWIIKGIGLIGLAVIVWMTWFFGYTYVKLVTQPKDPTPRSQVTTDQKEVVLTLDPLEFWTCQTGVFKSEDNARKEKERLQHMGWDAQIISKDPFIIGIGLDYSKEEVVSIQELLKEGGVVSVPKWVSSPERAFRIRGSGADRTAEILQGVNAFLKTPYGSRESALADLEHRVLSMPHNALTDLQDAAILTIKAERTLPRDMKKIMSLHLYGEYQKTLETLRK